VWRVARVIFYFMASLGSHQPHNDEEEAERKLSDNKSVQNKKRAEKEKEGSTFRPSRGRQNGV
jgi:hypothetical protein